MQQNGGQLLAVELKDAAHVWLLRTDEITGSAQLADCAATLSADEKDLCQRFRFDADRHLYMVSHAMLRHVLSAYNDIDPASWQFGRTIHGRPEIAAPEIALPLRFNLSHTRGLAACVVTRAHDCGVDAEKLTGSRNSMEIARRMFAEQEVQALQGLEGAALLDRFLTYWTLREACCKALGSGLAGSGRRFRFEADDKGDWQVRFVGGQGAGGDWQLATRQVFDACKVAVAIRTGCGHALEISFRDFVF